MSAQVLEPLNIPSVSHETFLVSVVLTWSIQLRYDVPGVLTYMLLICIWVDIELSSYAEAISSSCVFPLTAIDSFSFASLDAKRVFFDGVIFSFGFQNCFLLGLVSFLHMSIDCFAVVQGTLLPCGWTPVEVVISVMKFP